MTTNAHPTKEDIIALETSYWEAMKAKNGARTAQLSSKVTLVTGAQGVMSIAKNDMGKMTEGGKWTLDSYVFHDIAVTIPTPDVAVIAYGQAAGHLGRQAADAARRRQLNMGARRGRLGMPRA